MSSSTRSAKRSAETLAALLTGLITQAASADSLGFDNGDAVPTVITATRLQQSLLDVPASVSIIDQTRIRASGARELPDLLRLVPGLVTARESGSVAFVSYHGTSIDEARRMQVLVDGRSIYGAGLARVDWIGLPLDVEDVERIEVVRGPNSATYGANSFLGVINIITRHPQDGANVEARVRQGQNGIADAYGRLALHGLGADWSWTAFHREDDGFDYNAKYPSRPFPDRKQVDGLYTKGVWMHGDGQVTFSGGLARMEAEQPRVYDQGLFRAIPVSTSDNGYISLDLDQALSEKHRLKAAYYVSVLDYALPLQVHLPYLGVSPELGALWRSDNALGEAFVDDPVNTCASPSVATNARLRAVCLRLADSNYTSDRAYNSDMSYRELRQDVELSDTWVPNPAFRLVFGSRATFGLGESRTYLNGSADSQVYSLFAHGEWRFARSWLLNLGGSQEYDTLSGDYFSPRAALSWHFSPNQVLRLVQSNAVRTPDLFEQRANWHLYATTADRSQSRYDGALYQSALSPGNARTEHIRSSELSYYGQFQPLRLSLDLRLFRDELDLVNNRLRIESFALGDYQHQVMQGGEVATRWQMTALQRIDLSYARLAITDLADQANSNYVPRHSGALGWSRYDPDGWRASLLYGFYSNLGSGDLRYDRLDAHLGRVLPLGRQRLDLGVNAQMRFTDDPELRTDNGTYSRNKVWASAGWRF